jgi:hypothetical protein
MTFRPYFNDISLFVRNAVKLRKASLHFRVAKGHFAVDGLKLGSGMGRDPSVQRKMLEHAQQNGEVLHENPAATINSTDHFVLVTVGGEGEKKFANLVGIARFEGHVDNGFAQVNAVIGAVKEELDDVGPVFRDDAR